MTSVNRFPQLAFEELSGPQKDVAEHILRVSSAGLGGPYSFLLRSPEMAARLLNLFDYLRFGTSVPLRLNEMAILIQARLWTAQYEWWAHHPLALKAGLPEHVAAALKEGRRPATMAADEAVVYDYSIELCKTKKISDLTFKRAMTALGEQQIVDLTVLIGSYVTVSMVLNAGEVAIPGGGAPPLAPMIDPFPLG